MNSKILFIQIMAVVPIFSSMLHAATQPAIAAGSQHSLFLKSDGIVWSCGANWAGQIGDGTYSDRSVPAQVISNVKAIAAGEMHSLFLKTDGLHSLDVERRRVGRTASGGCWQWSGAWCGIGSILRHCCDPMGQREAAGGCEVAAKSLICRAFRRNAMGQHMASIPAVPTESETESKKRIANQALNPPILPASPPAIQAAMG